MQDQTLLVLLYLLDHTVFPCEPQEASKDFLLVQLFLYSLQGLKYILNQVNKLCKQLMFYMTMSQKVLYKLFPLKKFIFHLTNNR